MQKKIDVKPNEVINHNDPSALCTKAGWERYQNKVKMWKAGSVVDFGKPVVFEDHRPSGRFSNGYK